MNKSKKQNTKNVKYIVEDGYVDIFYSFNLCSEKKYFKTINKINEFKLIIIDKQYNEGSGNDSIGFTKEFDEFLLKRRNKFSEYKYNQMQNIYGKENIEYDGNNMKIKISKEIFLKLTLENAITNLSNCNNGINEDFKEDIIPGIDSKGVKTAHNDKLFISQSKALTELVGINNADIKILQNHPNTYKMQWLLQPFKIKILSNIEYVNVFLDFFENGNAILRLSMPLTKIDLSEFYDDNWFNKVEEIFLPRVIIDKTEDNEYIKCEDKLGISGIAKLYMNYLKEAVCGDLVKRYDIYTNITLLDYSLQPNTFDAASIDLKELVFGILFCPFNSLTIQEDKVYNAIWDKNYYSMSKNLRYYFSTNDRSIAIHTTGINNLTYNGCNLNNSSFYFAAIHGILQCIENTLLKKYIYDEYMIVQLNDEISLRELRNLKKDMLHNENFLYSIWYRAYGSVVELMKFAEKKASIFLGIDDLMQRGRKIEELISLRESEVKDKFSIIIGISTVLIAIMLGLPNIQSTSKSIDVYMNPRMKSYVDISQYSIPIWITVNLCIIIIIFFVFRRNIYRRILGIKRKFKYKK